MECVAFAPVKRRPNAKLTLGLMTHLRTFLRCTSLLSPLLCLTCSLSALYLVPPLRFRSSGDDHHDHHDHHDHDDESDDDSTPQKL